MRRARLIRQREEFEKRERSQIKLRTGGADPNDVTRPVQARALRRDLYGEGSHFSCRMYRASAGESPDRDDRRRGAGARDSINIRAVPFAKCRYAMATSTPVARASDSAAASLRWSVA
jgi:hypothetical protein